MIRTERQSVNHGAVMTQRDRRFHFRFSSLGIDPFRNWLCYQLF